MNTNSMRQKLHNYLEVADDKKVKAIYKIMEDEIAEKGISYTEDQKSELDRRWTAYENGVEKTVTAEMSKKRIKRLLDSKIK